MTLIYGATWFSLRLEQFPSVILPIKNSPTSPLNNSKPHPNPISTALLLLCADEPKFRCSTPEGAVGPPRVKTNNSSKADFQSLPNTREAPPPTAHNLTSRFSKLEKLFANEMAACCYFGADLGN